ncbi:MAG: two-component regulator propeller domain-containing protein [Pyrinomonadaceae bacterium]
MQIPIRSKKFLKLSVSLFLILLALSTYFAQQPDPSATPSPEASPSASPTPNPPRAPSPTPLPGAQNFHQWGSITVFNGLPSDSVRAIAQTPDGVMWFGTDNGLARFDGRRIQNFSPDGSGLNRILSLKTARSGELWVGTQAGAFVYRDSGFELIEGTKGIGVTAILAGEEVLLGTDTGMVMRIRYDGSGKRSVENLMATPIQTTEEAPLAVTGLLEAEFMLVASTSGKGLFTIADGRADEVLDQRVPRFINALAADEKGNILLAADAATGASGFYEERSGLGFVRSSLPTARVLALEGNDSGLWVGTERFGVFHVVGSKVKKAYTFENTSGGLRSNTVYTFFTDREGVVWIGTNRGVSRFDRLGAEQQTISDSANSNFIRSLFRARKDRTFAGTNRGLYLSHGNTWKSQPGFDGKAIYAIAEHKSTELLIGTSAGIFDLRGRLIAPGDSRGFANTPDGTYAAVYGRGVLQILAGARGFGLSEGPMPVVFSQPDVTAIAGANEKLWIGTANSGLFSVTNRSIKAEFDPATLASGTIWRLYTAADGTLWIGGQHGVFRVRDQRAEKVIDAEEVRDVFVDGNYIWAATTTRGLVQARFDERFGLLVSEVGFEQGLPSEKAFSIIPDDDGILVATNRGVVTYRRGTVPPKIIVTRIASQRSHDLREAASTIDLEYPQNSLLIEVAGQSSRTFPEEFQYAFVLTSSKGEEIDRRLSNDFQYSPVVLSAGEYTIEAIAFNRDLLASEPLMIRFSVARAPFPWTATALGVLLLIALMGLVWAFVANRRVLVRNREIAAAKLDLANEAERERRRIARDLHDQTLADLRSLMLLSDAAKPEIAGFRDEIEAISGEVRRICEDLSPSVLENVGLVAALEFLLKGAIANHSFAAKEDLEENLGFSMNIQLQIYRIAQEVLTNIKNHSSADRVDMTVDESDGEFVMEICDNGDPFDPESVTSIGRGIASINARASMIAADIGWDESSDGGNRFVLKISEKKETI